VVITTGIGSVSPSGLEQPREPLNPNGFQAWKADTPSAGVEGPGCMIKEDAEGLEGRHTMD
jgi:hypothetical protein